MKQRRQYKSVKKQLGYLIRPLKYGFSPRQKAITIAGSTGAGTNYQVLLKVGESSTATGCDFYIGHTASFPTASSTGSTLGDLQFLSSDNVTQIPAWVEQVTGSAPNRVAWIWVKVLDDLGTSKTIYCVYNNRVTVQYPDGNGVFQLFDDFTGTSLDTTKWKYLAGSGGLSFGGGVISITGATAFITLASNASFSDNAEVVSRKWPADTINGTAGICGFDNSIRTDKDWDTSGKSEVRWETTGGVATRVNLDASYTSTYYRIRIRRSGGAGSVLINDVLKYSVASGVDTANKQVWLGNVYDAGMVDRTDWVAVKKYITTEPAFSSVGSETAYTGTPTGSVKTYPTWDPTQAGTSATLSSSLLMCDGAATSGYARATLGMSNGVYYWECTSNGSLYPIVGIGQSTSNSGYPGKDSTSYGFYGNTSPVKINNAVQTAYGVAWNATSQVIGVKFDATSGTLEFFNNGTSMGVAFTNIPRGTYYPMTGGYTDTGTSNCTANFGELGFTYTVPSGAKALYRLDAPITDPSTISGLILWLDGNDSTKVVANGSNQVSSWIDKSASGLTFTQATTTNMPLWDSTIFPRKCINFGISTNSWLTTSTPLSVPATSTVFIVMYWGTRSASYMSLNLQHGTSTVALNSNAGVPYWSIYTAATGLTGYPNAALEFANSGTVYSYTPTAAVPKGTTSVVSFRVPGSVTKSLLRESRASRKTTHSSTDVPGVSSIDTIGSTDSTYVVNGAIAEVLIYNTALTDVQMRQIEDYLAAKWGTS